MKAIKNIPPSLFRSALVLMSIGMVFPCGANAQTQPFTLTSPDLADGAFSNKHVLNGFGCKGENVSPALSWQGAPEGTQSFALQVYDPDAPTGSGFWHWTVYNIPATVTQLPQGAGNASVTLPKPAFAGRTDFQDTGVTASNGGYGRPCPPVGDKPHRYVFTLYALAVSDVTQAAAIPKTGSAALYGFALNRGLGSSVLAKASFTATYGR